MLNLLNYTTIRVLQTLGADVLNTAHNISNKSLYFYINSNKPSNRPVKQGKDCDWGSYIIIKSDSNNSLGIIIYIGDNFIVKISFKNDTQSLNW